MIKARFIVLMFLMCISSIGILLADNTIEISGSCVSGTVILSESGTNDGKMAYTGTGTIYSVSGTQFAIWWDASESKWFLALDGQPFWYNSDNTTLPNSTLLSGNWSQADLSQGTCDVVIQGTATNMPVSTSVSNAETDLTTIYSKGEIIFVKQLTESENTISVYDLGGKKLKEIKTDATEMQFSGLNKGAFIVKIQSSQGVKTQIVLVE